MTDTLDKPPAAVERPTTHTGYRLLIEPSGQHIQVIFNGVTVAASDAALIMYETRLTPVYYFPRADVHEEYLQRSDSRSYCPFKGDATYWSLQVGDQSAPDAAWSYLTPFDEASAVADYIAFYWDVPDRWLGDGIALDQPPQAVDKANSESTENPFVDWLLTRACRAESAPQLVGQLATALNTGGMPVARIRLLLQTLNPLLFAHAYTWQQDKDDGEVQVFAAEHTGLHGDQFQNSPFAAVLAGEGGLRRRLDIPQPRLDFPILEELIADGATDYVAMPLRFSDGQVNIISLVSHQPGGFSLQQLGYLYEILPNLSRQLEAHAQRLSSEALLKAYLGDSAGELVMSGLVKRGDGQDLHAAIWFSDLRGSTELASRLSRDAYLETLNQFFDAVAGTALAHDGEVLKFIGDGVLAIFPINDPSERHPQACINALAAAHEAHQRIATLNRERRDSGETPLAFGVGLHRGDLSFGNVGTDRRLDFTIIGTAVNEAARIEGLCKTLDASVLMSPEFTASVPGRYRSRGRHELRGLGESELFALPD